MTTTHTVSSRPAVWAASRPWDPAVMAAEVRRGLLTGTPPELPSKYFYDDLGSELFEAITLQPEYYQTRTEEALLDAHADGIVAEVGPVELVELGSGAGRKVRLFLDAMQARRGIERAMLFDINEAMLQSSLAELEAAYPRARLEGVVGDLTKDLYALRRGGRRLLLLLAGTIGNLHPNVVPGFFERAAAQLAPGDGFVVGLDLVKDPARLHAAYNDAAGVTARFNKNVLRVMNERLGADFDLEAFEHVAFYDADRAWIEMRLRTRRAVSVRLPACHLRLDLPKGGEIRTELSCKYTRESFEARLGRSGLRLDRWITDPDALFALAVMRR